MVQDHADIEKQRHGNPLVSEKFIDVLRSAVDLLGKPSGGASLVPQLGFDAATKMKILWTWY